MPCIWEAFSKEKPYAEYRQNAKIAIQGYAKIALF